MVLTSLVVSNTTFQSSRVEIELKSDEYCQGLQEESKYFRGLVSGIKS